MKKNILITGCSSGLGLSLVKLYLQKNYNVYGISRRKPEILHDNFYFKSFDLSKYETIKDELTPFLKEIEDIEIAFLNAGVLGDIKEMKNLSITEIQRVQNINLFANKEILDILSMLNVKNIIATSSGAAINGSLGWGAYSLSKASLNMLINLYSKEMENTKLIALAPGVIETPMTDHIRFKIDDNIFTSAKVLKNGEIQTPTDAAIRIESFIKRVDEFESGSFVDIRKI